MTATNLARDCRSRASFSTSSGFVSWLFGTGSSLAITSYQLGKLILLGAPAQDRLSVSQATFQRCLGVCASGRSIFVATRDTIVKSTNIVAPTHQIHKHDALFLPKVAWYTGDVQAHDVGVMKNGKPIFVNTLFDCLACIDESTNFRSVWRPPFVSSSGPGDRCHLNGLAMNGGIPSYATCAATTDEPGGWRHRRLGGGCVIDIREDAVLARGLTMPHSPRYHCGRLFLCNSGTGEFGEVELSTGRFLPIAFCRGFLRGLSLHDDCAIVGISEWRHVCDFQGLPLDKRLQDEDNFRCGLDVIHLASGRPLHWLRFPGPVQEIYDVALVAGTRSPGIQSPGSVFV
jgi:uncharacterized protein (TIGR03032 family)